MDFNKKFEELLTEARGYGYDFICGRFVESEQIIFPVMEVFLLDSTVYEDAGHYHIFKHTYKIRDEDYEEVMSYCKTNDGKKIRMGGDFEEDDEFFDIDCVVESYIRRSGIYYWEANTGGTIEIRYRHYHRYTDNDECIDLIFSKKEENDDFPIGYVSFYKMKNSDYMTFAREENVNIRLNKFMRWN